MQFIAAWIGALIAPSVIQALLTRVAVSLGIGAVSYVGFNLLLSYVESQISSGLGQLGFTLMAFVDIFGVREGLSIIVSAIATRLLVSGLTSSGKLTKIYWDKSNSIVLNP